MRRRINKDHNLTGAEKKRRFDDKYASIDSQMADAFKNIDQKRKQFASLSLQNFVDTYLMGVLFEDPPSKKMRGVMDLMQSSIDESTPTQLMLARGCGKTTVTEALLLWLLLYGKRKFVVIVSANARSSSNILRDIWRVIQDSDTPIAQDFPEVCLPYQLVGGATRRRQLFNGVSTDLQHTNTDLVFPRLKKDDGMSEYPTSGSVLTVRGITSGIRGLKRNALRPDCVLLDDLQTSATASNPEQVDKLFQLLNADIMNLSSKGKIGVICCATPICDDDLTFKLKRDVNWRTIEFPYIINFPDDCERGEKSLWAEYYKIYDIESIEQRKHTESLEFYKKHFDEMNKGAELFSERFSKKDGHISGLQAIMDRRHLVGEKAFQAEFQMNPLQLQSQLNITPDIVLSRTSNLNELEIPQSNVQFVCASSDLNVSKWICTVVMVFMRDGTSTIIWHKFKKCRISASLPPEDYKKKLYDALSEHGKELKKLGIPIQAWAIDGNGLAWDAVTEFSKNSTLICGIPSCSFVGRASHLFRPFVRSRLKEAVNNTVLCGDNQEKIQSGAGKKWQYHNSDYFHECVQKGFLTEVGNIGSISWYKGGDHTKCAIQICGEKLVSKVERSDGTVEYRWKENGDCWDFLDAVGQCLAAYASMGFASQSTGKASFTQRRQITKPRYRIV